MADWRIQPEHAWEAEWRAKHGDQEFERRLAIADRKADELLGLDGTEDEGLVSEKLDRASNSAFAEATIMRPQFRSIIMQIDKPETLAKAEALPGQRWARLVYKLAGV